MAESEGLRSKGARAVSVFGPFGSKTLVEMSTDLALELFDCSLPEAAPMHVIDGVLQDLAAIAEIDEALATSTLAATALQLAYEMANPYNSATSKSMCAKALIETMERLRELAPPKRESDGVDELEQRRVDRRSAAGGSTAAD